MGCNFAHLLRKMAFYNRQYLTLWLLVVSNQLYEKVMR